MLQGTLDEFPLIDVLGILKARNKTGRLDIERQAGRGLIYVRLGEPYYAESSLTRSLIGQKLVDIIHWWQDYCARNDGSMEVQEARFAPGERLPTQRARAAELGVNMASVREGVKRLDQLGLVEVRHGDAMRVRDWRAHGGLDVLVYAATADPEAIGDEFFLTPLTSYGTQKAIGELLLSDYSRRGFFDGVGIRLPTICVRPGTPNKAASGFFSNIIREPLKGEEAVLPVSEDASARSLALPFHARRPAEDQERVVEALRRALE